MLTVETTASTDPNPAENGAGAEPCLPFDPRAERDARHLAMLKEVEETNLVMQTLLLDAARRDARRQLQAETEQDPNPPRSRLDVIARAQAGLARELRRLMDMEIRVDDARLDRQMGLVREATERRAAAARRADSRASCGDSLKWSAREALEDIIEAEAGEDADRADALLAGMYDRLDALCQSDRGQRLCVGQMVVEIVADLGMSPDWSEWRDEDWAEEMTAVEGSPYGPEPRVIRDPDGRYRFSGAVREPDDEESG